MGSISIISFAWFLLLASQSHSSNNIHDEYLSCLRSQDSTSIVGVTYSRNNSSFVSVLNSAVRNLRPLASPFFSGPNLIITPSHESEIQIALRCATKTNTQIRVLSGGHDYEGISYASTTPFVLIDLVNYRSISINTKKKTAWVKSGATLGELYHKIAVTSKNLGFPAGVCPTVGVGGHFSGGGYSMMSRKFGLAIDNIIDAKVMDVNGNILESRKSMGKDLFWAIRGGGGTSFGIVLAWKIRLRPVPEKVTIFNVTRTLEQNAAKLLEKWQLVASTIDKRLSIRVFIHVVGDENKTIYVYFTSLFLGEADELLVIMRNGFPELGLKEEDCKEMNWIESVLFFSASSPNIDDLLKKNIVALYFKGKSDYVTRPISENGWRGICDRLLGEGEFPSRLQLSPHGGRMSQISEFARPFPHREGTLCMIHYSTWWKNETETSGRINSIRSLYQFMASYVSKSPRGAYINYRDFDLGATMNNRSSYESAKVWGTNYFKNNFNRLVRIKTKVDPNNFFRNEQSIPPISGI